MDILHLLKETVRKGASDLHVSAGLVPRMRIDGRLIVCETMPLSHETLMNALFEMMNDAEREIYRLTLEIDFAFEMIFFARFRVNVFQQARGIAAVFRVIPYCIPSLDALQLPRIVMDLTAKNHGLILVTGSSGSGKSTTLAAMVEHINLHEEKHVITIEDPIEFVYKSQKSLIHQREVERDTQSFSSALRAALREDPDVILVGELRDTETIRQALKAAETGHLVLATLHTQSAPKAIHRLIDAFSGEEKSFILSMLSSSLCAVIGQVLLPKIGGGRIPALEVMIKTPAIAHCIREGKIEQMYSAMQTGQAEGMFTLEQYMQHLVKEGKIEVNSRK